MTFNDDKRPDNIIIQTNLFSNNIASTPNRC